MLSVAHEVLWPLAEASAVGTPRQVIDYFGCVLLRCGRVMWLEKEATGR